MIIIPSHFIYAIFYNVYYCYYYYLFLMIVILTTHHSNLSNSSSVGLASFSPGQDLLAERSLEVLASLCDHLSRESEEGPGDICGDPGGIRIGLQR